MSTHSYAVIDKGLVVKMEELDIDKVRAFIQENEGVKLKPEDGASMLDALRDFLTDDCQWFIGKEWTDGVICHQWSYGNDICGDFVPLIKGVTDIGLSVECDEWVMMCLPRYASLFEQAYASEEALITEMKELYSKLLPEDFDYKSRLAELNAVVWG